LDERTFVQTGAITEFDPELTLAASDVIMSTHRGILEEMTLTTSARQWRLD
jgi:hypothetical protein